MKKISKIFLTTALGGALSLAAIGSVMAASNADVLPPRADFQAQHEAMKQAFDQGYDAWAALMAQDARGSEMLKVITKDNFPKLQESHKLMEQAHDLMTQAEAIHTELGLPKSGRKGFGHRHHKMFDHNDNDDVNKNVDVVAPVTQ